MPVPIQIREGRKRCTRCDKIVYTDEAKANSAALRIGEREPMRPYFDNKCGWWHVSRRGGPEWYAAQTAMITINAPPPMSFNGKMVARDYQDASIFSIFDYFKHNTGNPLVALPTGTGKSYVIAEFNRRVFELYPDTKVMMLTHVHELITQNFDTLMNVWPTAPAGIYSAGIGRRDVGNSITYAGIQSVHRKPELFGHIDLIEIDEAHLVSPKSATMYRKFIDALREINPMLKVIGFTATAFRLGQGMLTDDDGLFDDVCFDLTERDSFNWMIAQGWIAPLIPKKTDEQLDISGVRMSGGEFILSDLQNYVDQDRITIAALAEANMLAVNRNHWLVFASGIEHAEHVVEFLVDKFGISATCVHSKIPKEERAKRITDFKAGRIRVMVNNNILTTGFDFPAIDCIVMLRPTASPGLWVQMLGRGTRPFEGKSNCLVLDFAGNTQRLGPINDPVLPRKKGKGPKGIAPVRLCEFCGCWSHASCRFCENPECGMEFPVNVKIRAAASVDKLIAGSTPEIHQYSVNNVIYKLHKGKKGKPNSMKVTYYAGLRRFNEYICLDHSGYASRIARQWWELRSPWGVPPDVPSGLMAVDHLRVPSRISVIENKRYPEIAGYEFD